MADLPLWLHVAIAAHRSRWITGRCRTCEHASSPEQAHGFLVAWKPDLVTCAHCTHLARLIPGSPGEHRCDRCKRTTAGTDDDHTLTSQITMPDLTYTFALCAVCRAEMPS